MRDDQERLYGLETEMPVSPKRSIASKSAVRSAQCVTHENRRLVAMLLVASGFLVAGCASTPQPKVSDRPVGPAVEDVLGEFVRSWNEGSAEGVRVLFEPSRRVLLDRSDDGLRASMRSWEILGWRVERSCHPRGAHWLYARLQRRARQQYSEHSVEDTEVVWLHYQEDRWWMYSL